MIELSFYIEFDRSSFDLWSVTLSIKGRAMHFAIIGNRAICFYGSRNIHVFKNAKELSRNERGRGWEEQSKTAGTDAAQVASVVPPPHPRDKQKYSGRRRRASAASPGDNFNMAPIFRCLFLIVVCSKDCHVMNCLGLAAIDEAAGVPQRALSTIT